MSDKFIFYDLETSGLSSEFDQVLQFAAIVTDDKFEVLDTVNIRSRLSPHILPNPIALAVTGVMPSDFLDPLLPSYLDFSGQIREFLIKHTPATWVGYNSISFDESHLRQMFYQTLQPNVYETQFNGNNRFDILLLVQACKIIKPDILNWPLNEKKKVSFKLEFLAPANGFDGHNAHDALGDVEATIHLARLIAEGAPELWKSALENRNKQSVITRLKKFEPIEFIINNYGYLKKHTLCFCCLDGSYAVLFNVAEYDPEELFDATEEELTKVISKNSKVIRTVAINKVPNLFDPQDNDEIVTQRCEAIQINFEFQSRLLKVIKRRYDDREVDENLVVEEKIYEGFYSDADKRLLFEFQNASWVERRNILTKISDIRLKQLGRRLVMFHDEVEPSSVENDNVIKYLTDKWLSDGESKKEKWTTFARIEKDLKTVEEKQFLPKEKVQILKDFYNQVRSSIENNTIPHR